MPRLRANDTGFALVPVLAALTAIAIIAFAGIHVWTHTYHAPPSLPMGSTDGGPFVVESPGPISKGDLSATYSYKDNVLPNTPNGYQLLNLMLANGNAEADYITSRTAAAVHADAVALCNAHRFKFQTTANDNINVICISTAAEWQFTILPASNFIQQPWYTLDQLNEATLAKSVWLQLVSSRPVSDGEPPLPAHTNSK